MTKYKKITQEEFDLAAEKHKIWLKNIQALKDIWFCPNEAVTEQKMRMNEVDLRHINFRRANLKGVDLRGADLRDANLIGADLRDANLEGAFFDKGVLENLTWSK